MKIYHLSINYISNLFKNSLVKNSSWGVLSQFSQTIFLSLFFVILARKYPTDIFAKYIIAWALYQLVTAFSTMGLSQWFIREFISAENKDELTSKFLKMQAYFGCAFYVINIILAYLIYNDQVTRMLILVLGSNVVFDNLINAIKCLNIAMLEQKKTFIILTIETVLKFVAACVLFIYPFSIITLSILILAIRFLTLNLFLTLGTPGAISIRSLIKFKVYYADIKRLVILNWAFIIIGGVSIINWRLANIVISKMLTSFDVANYEISFKVFSIAQTLPVVISTSVFPLLVKLYGKDDKSEFLAFYKKVHVYYLLFGLAAYTFIYSFSGQLIPLVFGVKYLSNAVYTQQMFLTILIFPTALLQANMLITINLEKLDMVFNTLALIVNFAICIIGLNFIKSLSVVNYSIFASFLVFHIAQDAVLIKRGITTFKSAATFYFITIIFVVSYVTLSKIVNAYGLFGFTWMGILFFVFFKPQKTVYQRYKLKKSYTD
jgi:O-antigen/teichoic acid export membrane protein